MQNVHSGSGRVDSAVTWRWIIINLRLDAMQKSRHFDTINASHSLIASAELPEIIEQNGTKVWEKGHKSEFFGQNMTSGSSEN